MKHIYDREPAIAAVGELFILNLLFFTQFTTILLQATLKHFPITIIFVVKCHGGERRRQ
jgi:hypothetical protein